MGIMWGALLDEFKKEDDKQLAREAAKATKEAELAAEIAKEERLFERDMLKHRLKGQMDVGFATAKEAEKIELNKPVLKAQYEREDEVEERKRARELADKQAENLFNRGKDMLPYLAKNTEQLTPELIQSLKTYGISPVQINVLRQAALADTSKLSNKELKKMLTDLDVGSQRGHILWIGMNESEFQGRFARVFKEVMPNTNISAYYKKLKQRVGKHRAVMYAKNATEGRKGDAVEFSGGTVMLPKAFARETKGDVNMHAELTNHRRHAESVMTSISNAINSGMIEVNNINDRETIQSQLRSITNTRNSILRALGDQAGSASESLESYEDLQSYKNSRLKQLLDKGTANTDELAVSGNPVRPIQQVKKPTTPKPPVASTVSDEELIRNPEKAGLGVTFIPDTYDKNDPSIQYFNNHRKKYGPPRHKSSYFFAPHQRIEGILSTKGEDVQNSPEFRKAYLTSVLSRKFQTVANDPNNVQFRGDLQKDTEFHEAIYELEQLDKNFDGHAALAEAIFLSSPTHSYDGSLGEGRKIAPVGADRVMLYHEMKKTSTGRYEAKPTDKGRDQLGRRRKNAYELYGEIESVLDMAELVREKGQIPIGQAATAAQAAADVVKVVTDFSKAISDFMGNRENPHRTSANEKAMETFFDRMTKEANDLESQKSALSTDVYTLRAMLISSKISLAYKLSATLQGDGTGGGRTISDTDFQYALQAIWGSTEESIEGRLMKLRSTIERNERRGRLYEQYDKYGMATQITDFMSGYNAHVSKQRLKEIINNIAADDKRRSKAPKPSTKNPVDRHQTLQILTGRVENNIVEFGSMFSRKPKGSKDAMTEKQRQVGSIGQFVNYAIKDTSMMDVLLPAYKERLAKEPEMSTEAFVIEALTPGTTNKPNELRQAMAPLMNSMINTFYRIKDPSGAYRTNGDSILRSRKNKKGQNVIGVGGSGDPINIFQYPADYYHQKDGENTPKNLHYFVLSFALETLHNNTETQ